MFWPQTSGVRSLWFDRPRKRLDALHISNFTLQGSTPKEKRAAMVKAFNAGSASVFLISLKAGGTGLNLTAADIVIHYAPWWNPAAQDQATTAPTASASRRTCGSIQGIGRPARGGY